MKYKQFINKQIHNINESTKTYNIEKMFASGDPDKIMYAQEELLYYIENTDIDKVVDGLDIAYKYLHTYDSKENIHPSIEAKIEDLIELANWVQDGKIEFDEDTSIFNTTKIISSGLISEFPESIHILKNLEVLELIGGKIKTIPKNLQYCKNLLVLDLTSQEISDIPNWIYKIPKLVTLDLNWCEKLKELPNTISKCPSLYRLNILHTGITELPKGFDNCKFLTKISYCEDIITNPELVPTGVNVQTCISTDKNSKTTRFIKK